MKKKIGLFLSAVFCLVLVVTCIILNKKIDAGEKQLYSGQNQFAAGQKALQSGQARLQSGERKLSGVKSAYGVVDNTPIAVVKYMPVASLFFKQVDHKIASGDQQVAEGKQKVKAGQAQLAAGRIALSQGEKKLEMAKKIAFYLEIATGVFGMLALLFGISCLKDRKLKKSK